MREFVEARKRMFPNRIGKTEAFHSMIGSSTTDSATKSNKVKNGLGNPNEKRVRKRDITIRLKLITSFLVPIAFIIILGVVSFWVASNAIVKNYEKSALQTMNMTGKYLQFGLTAVDATSAQYANDETVSKFYLNLFTSNKTEYSSVCNNIRSMISNKKLSDEFISEIYFISDDALSVSTKGSFNSGLYKEFTETDLGIQLKKNHTMNSWVGSNEYLDKNLGVTSKDYAWRLVRNNSKANAMMIIDVSAQTVQDILSGLEYNKLGYLAVVTADGKEITAKGSQAGNNKTAIFTGEKFYQQAMNSNTSGDSDYVKYKGKTYLFVYTKVKESGSMVCTLIPKDVISSQADNIQKVTVIIVIIAIILAVGTAILISQGIDRTIKGIILRLKEAAKGDLTVKFKSRRRDEFYSLIEEIQITFSNMKGLIQHVNGLSTEVSSSSDDITKISELFLKSFKNISNAMDEIEQGISQQAKDAEECLSQMDNLSQKIALVSDTTKEIGQITDSTQLKIQEGTIVTEDLNEKTQSTIKITTDIINDIERLEAKSLSISKIISVINEISNQTNLLSLNASIEAARAGAYGKGFSVVASEIRKLAEQSQGSVNEIRKIIESIQGDTKKAAATAKNAESVLKLQAIAVKNTTDSFKNINDSVEKLMVYLNYIAQNVGNIEEARVSTLGAIENISAVLEEIAASTNSVNQTSNEQLESVEALNKASEMLNHNADTLVVEVNKFKVV